MAKRLGYGGVDMGFLTDHRVAGGDDDADARSGLSDDAAAALEGVARTRDLIVMAWGASIDARCAAQATQLLFRELACHAGSLAVLGWSLDGQPLDVTEAGKGPALSCVCCSTSYEHDWRFDRLAMGVAS